MSDLDQQWFRADKGRAGAAARDHVRRIEQNQGDTFDRFLKLEVLYDPHSPDAGDAGVKLDHVQENIIASNIDTVSASISTTEIIARFPTDGADWGQQRMARHLEWYAEEVAKDLGILPKCRRAFKECAKKGTALTKSHVVFDAPRVDLVMIENVVVDDTECDGGRAPRTLHQWEYIDAEELAARYPKAELEIERARRTRSSRRRWRAGSLAVHDVEVLHSYRLPVGVAGVAGYRAGRHVTSIDGHDLDDKPWTRDDFPFAIIVWSERANSFYGISGSERVAGIQAALNRRNWQIERQLDQAALPTTYVRPADAGLTVKTSRVGAMAVVKSDYPHTVIPTAVSGETYQSRIDLREAGNNEFGQSQMATHAAKPAGIDSGVALREYKDQSSTRFALQEKAFEDLVLRTITNTIACCKDLGAKAPMVLRHSRFGRRRIKWANVDLRDVKITIAAASNLNRSPAGRKQAVIEYAQAGIISQDEARELMQHPDLERALSLYTAALENVEHCLDEIADGSVVVPEPFMNLKMCTWRGQMEYLIWRDNGAPEEVLEALRQFVVQSVWLQKKQAAPAMAPGAAPPMDPGMVGDPGMGAAAPASAFAGSAMQLQAS